ncbi:MULTISPECIES: hypothetical protein [unclassified Kitasatospora]|uniref:hypothetical protein n=1 Tax=Kitasatospora sp. NPDC001261 TaxID=3364012 RepID=UPI0036BAEC1B
MPETLTTPTPELRCPCGGTFTITVPAFLHVVQDEDGSVELIGTGLDVENAKTECDSCDQAAPAHLDDTISNAVCSADNELCGIYL